MKAATPSLKRSATSRLPMRNILSLKLKNGYGIAVRISARIGGGANAMCLGAIRFERLYSTTEKE